MHMQGAIAAAVGTGASLSQVIAGAIVHHAGFLFLTAIASAVLMLFYRWMPETLHLRMEHES